MEVSNEALARNDKEFRAASPTATTNSYNQLNATTLKEYQMSFKIEIVNTDLVAEQEAELHSNDPLMNLDEGFMDNKLSKSVREALAAQSSED